MRSPACLLARKHVSRMPELRVARRYAACALGPMSQNTILPPTLERAVAVPTIEGLLALLKNGSQQALDAGKRIKKLIGEGTVDLYISPFIYLMIDQSICLSSHLSF